MGTDGAGSYCGKLAAQSTWISGAFDGFALIETT